jgi:hypothetical protein
MPVHGSGLLAVLNALPHDRQQKTGTADGKPVEVGAKQ